MPSPHPGAAGLLPSPHSASAGARPPLMKRHSSQQSHTSGGKHAVLSPGSVGEHHAQQPPRHHVKPVRKTKIVLPRNNSSARNLARLGRHGSDQFTNAKGEVGEGRKHSRQKSQEGEKEEGIRLPGSLGGAEGRPQMRRNLTSSNLPRNTSHTKLKKNLSHGQLARIGSGRNLQGLNNVKGPPSPGLKGKSRKKRSLDSGHPEKDLHEQEMEIARQQQEAKEGPRRKVGFAVGDGNDSSEEEDHPQMEGSGLQEDEWTDQSASASPATTRQNTANDSRRPSVSVEKPPERSQLREGFRAEDMVTPAYQRKEQPPAQEEVKQDAVEADGTPPEDESESEDEEDPPSPRSVLHNHKSKEVQIPPTNEPKETENSHPPQQASTPKSLLHGANAKDHPNPFTKHLLNRTTHSPAPALVSNVSALDDSHSARASPAASLRSSRSNIADPEDELVSRFIPSASHPTTGSGGNTTMNTPKIGSYQTLESESTLAAQNREGNKAVPASPGSTISGGSGAATPAMLRSRTELRMANERAMAEIEGSGKPQLMIPAHRFDRRNESLKSYLNVAALGGGGGDGAAALYGPEIFEGRFKAVNAELKVVQRFRDPLSESLARLQRVEGGGRFRALRGKRGDGGSGKKVGALAGSRSAVGLDRQGGDGGSAAGQQDAAKAASPAKSAMLASSKSAVNVAQRGGGSEGRKSAGGGGRVKFSQLVSQEGVSGVVGEQGLEGADAVARALWEGVGARG